VRHRPHLATIHDVYLQTDNEFWKKWSSQREVSFLAKTAEHFIEKIVLRLPVKKVHTVSRTSKNDLVKTGIAPDRIAVIPNGINPSEYQTTSTKKSLQIAYIGRLIFYKNLDTVIKAFRKVCDQHPESRFYIAGKGPYEQSLKKLTRELNLQDNVFFLGRIMDQDKVKLLAESQLMVQPSLVECFGITVIESFCCGTPVLASNVMPLPELVKDGENGGATLPPFDERAWSDALLDYLQDSEKCRQQGENGKRLVAEKYTISKVVDRLEDLYREMISP
jgi:glycosyltransferase involved in cell wall biosynthesis